MTNRKLEALRNLADRPGTEAEGRLAREILAKVEAKIGAGEDFTLAEGWEDFQDRIRDLSAEEAWTLIEKRIREHRAQPLPTHWKCACGMTIHCGQKCHNSTGHNRIQEQIRELFKKGDRVYYNRWAYSTNDPATVQGYVKPKPENHDHPWAWIRLKFDRLKSPRHVPIYSTAGWHLSHQPLSEAEARKLRQV